MFTGTSGGWLGTQCDTEDPGWQGLLASNPVEKISKFLGHSSVNTTMSQYTNVPAYELVKTMKIPWLAASSSVV